MAPISFAQFELDTDTGELRRAGHVIPLERQPAVVLTVLVSRAGRLVPRADLRATIWPADVHVDFDRGLNYCIRELRAALGDDSKAPRFIETIPRQGYRFIAEVDTSPARSFESPRRWRRPRVATAALLATVLAGAAWDLTIGGSDTHHDAAVTVLRAVHDLVF